jgi:hypothetical protein
MDTGYVDGDHIVNSQNTYAVELLGPVTSSPSWQSRADQGFEHVGFTIDWDVITATALNVSRLLAWKMGIPLDGTRISRFAALAL